jgi:hypothetical protein
MKSLFFGNRVGVPTTSFLDNGPCMMLAGNAAFQRHWDFTDPAQMAVQLGATFGPFLKNAILLLMINAAVLGTTTISLSSAWVDGEVRGWEHSLQKRPHSIRSMRCA